MWGILITILSGALMSIQGVFNAGVTKETNIWLSSSFVQLTAFIVCVSGWLFTGHQSSIGALFQVEHKYMLLGGVLGAAITFTVIKSMNLLGPAKAVMLIVISQLVIAYVIELLGIFGVEKVAFDFKKLLGVALAIGGIILFKWEK